MQMTRLLSAPSALVLLEHVQTSGAASLPIIKLLLNYGSNCAATVQFRSSHRVEARFSVLHLLACWNAGASRTVNMPMKNSLKSTEFVWKNSFRGFPCELLMQPSHVKLTTSPTENVEGLGPLGWLATSLPYHALNIVTHSKIVYRYSVKLLLIVLPASLTYIGARLSTEQWACWAVPLYKHIALGLV